MRHAFAEEALILNEIIPVEGLEEDIFMFDINPENDNTGAPVNDGAIYSSQFTSLEVAFLKPLRTYALRKNFGIQQLASDASKRYTSWALINDSNTGHLGISIQVEKGGQKAYIYDHNGNLLYTAEGSIDDHNSRTRLSWPGSTELGTIHPNGNVTNTSAVSSPIKAYVKFYNPWDSEATLVNINGGKLCVISLKLGALHIKFTDCEVITNKALILVYALKIAYSVYSLHLHPLPDVKSIPFLKKPLSLSLMHCISELWVLPVCKSEEGKYFYDMMTTHGDIVLVCEISIHSIRITDRHGSLIFTVRGTYQQYDIHSQCGDLIGEVRAHYIKDGRNRIVMMLPPVCLYKDYFRVTSVPMNNILAVAGLRMPTAAHVKLKQDISISWKGLLLCHIFTQCHYRFDLGKVAVPTVTNYLYTDTLQRINPMIMSLEQLGSSG